MKTKLLIGGILLVLSFAGCKGCGGHDRTLLSFVPSDTKGALVFADLATTVKNLSKLIDKFSVGPLATFINQGHIELNRQIGFDPLDVKEIKKLGLAPSKGMALVPVNDQPLLIAGMSDKKILEKELQKRMKEIAAAQDYSRKTVSGVPINFISMKIGQSTRQVLMYTFSGDYVLIAGAKSSPGDLVELVQLKREQRLDTAGWYKDITSQTGKQPDMLLVVNGEKTKTMNMKIPAISKWIDKGLAWSVSIQPTSIETRVFVGLSSETAQKMMGFTEGINDAHLERYLPDDTVVALKLRADAGKLLDEAFGLDPNFKNEFDDAVQTAKKATGGDLEKESIRNLTGNLAMGLSLRSSDQINNLLRFLSQGQAEAPATPKKFENAIQFFYWAQVRDAVAWMKMLEKILSLTGESGLHVVKSTKQGTTVYRIESANTLDGTMFLLQKGDIIGGCFGENCLDHANLLLSGKARSLANIFSPGTKSLFERPSLAIGYLNWAQILHTVNGLDASAMGEGEMAAKMALDLAMAAVKNLKELTGSVHFSKEGIQISGRLELQ